MTRSSYKGPYVDPRVMKKIEGKKPGNTGVIKTWARASQIAPEMVGFTFGVHNGKDHIEVFVTEDMVGHRLGEFSLTRKFVKHGGKMQKELFKGLKESIEDLLLKEEIIQEILNSYPRRTLSLEKIRLEYLKRDPAISFSVSTLNKFWLGKGDRGRPKF